MQINEVHFEPQVAAWYFHILTERERLELIGHIFFAREYGLAAAYHRLPESAKVILRTIYRERFIVEVNP